MRYSHCFLSIAFATCQLSVFAFAETDAVTTARYPDADSVVVSTVCDIAYQPDGTSVERDETVTKILTERGRRAERVQSLSFSRRYGESRFVAISIVGTNGVERTVDFAKTLKESTDNSSVSANIYDPLDRRLACAVPSLAVGETLRVVTERKTKVARMKDNWSDIELFESTDPMLRAEVRITAPAARPLKKIAVRNPLGNLSYRTEKAADGATLHVWCATNSPQAFPEPDMPPLYTQLQNLYVSTVDSWQDLSRWYWNLCAPHLAKTNAAMVAKVRELIKPYGDVSVESDATGTSRPQDETASNGSLRAIFKFVSQEVRYMGLTLEDTSPGYEPHDVALTFENRYGVCRDKAALLVALLRIAGFEAYPVLIHVGAKMDPDVPTPFFNHAIVAVRAPGRQECRPNSAPSSLGRHSCRPLTLTSPLDLSPYILMDPTDESSRDLCPAYLGDCSYLVAHPEGETLRRSPVESPEKNKLSVDISGALESDGSVFAEAQIGFGGMNDTLFRHALVRRTPDERRKLFERLVARAYPGAELLRLDIVPDDLRATDIDLKASLAVRLPELVLRGESQDALTVPFLSPVLGLANWLFEGRTSLEKRRFTLELPSTASIAERVRLKLGENLGPVVSLPTAAPIEGKYAFARTFSVTNGVLDATRTLSVSALAFATNDYLRLREDLKRVEAQSRVRPLFAPNVLAEADVRNRLVRSEVDLDGPDSWTVTNTVEREILTYDGKKSFAEMKLGFHPSWKKVEVVSAVVSNRDGTVSRLTPKELNVLDCGWAASAPRYPAGKTLVVTLPRVEIGSVIRTVVATTVTNAPASYYGTYNFDVSVPTDRLEVRVNGWSRAVDRPRRHFDEPRTPAALFWRDVVTISSNDWSRAAAALRRAAKVNNLDPRGRISAKCAENEDPAETRGTRGRISAKCAKEEIRFIRDWMAKNIRVAGPSLYELPIDRQLTAPETVLAERYATRLDYVRTLCALLKGAGYDADIVFASTDAGDDPRLIRRDQTEYPNVRAYGSALCRVRLSGDAHFTEMRPHTDVATETNSPKDVVQTRSSRGCISAKCTAGETLFLGLENEYSPLGATPFERSHYFDPVTETFGVVTVPEPALATRTRDTLVVTLRENGAADFDLTHELWGSGVGAFRKRYAEMLPEIRDRHHQELLGAIADAASATGDLVTDVTGYPAKRSFSCYVPNYAVVQGGAMSVTLAPFMDGVIPLTGTFRRNPLALPEGDACETVIEVVFPEGYRETDHLPEPFVTHSPLDPSERWSSLAVEKLERDGRLVVRLTSRAYEHDAVGCVSRDYFPLFCNWSRLGVNAANRTLVVRRQNAVCIAVFVPICR